MKGFFYNRMESTDQTFKDIKQIVEENDIVQRGDLVIKIASMPIQERGMTNTLNVSYVD